MPLGPLAANAYVVGNEDTRACIVVDPGQEPSPLVERIRSEGWRVEAMLATHAHFDHIGGAAILQEATGATLYAPASEIAWLVDPERNLSAPLAGAGVPVVRLEGVRVAAVTGGHEFHLGSALLCVLATPGHTPGSLSLYAPTLGATGAVFTGDTLFAGTIGRSDLPGGDGARLLTSIRRELLALPPDTVVLPGHGRATSVEEERLLNPYLA
jgi:glyoxylase-like metal-dependent hydrolase (beta-lactamase superfamily II)